MKIDHILSRSYYNLSLIFNIKFDYLSYFSFIFTVINFKEENFQNPKINLLQIIIKMIYQFLNGKVTFESTCIHDKIKKVNKPHKFII